MKVAVVGAGFAGLALSFYLLEKGIEVDLFDAEGIGGGASGAAVGLLHPYAGEQVRRSYEATAALEEAKKLLSISQEYSLASVADYSGILRKADALQSQTFFQHRDSYKDVEFIEEGLFLLKSGIVVHSQNYLEGLFSALQAKGLQLKLQKIESAQELQGYDTFFLAIGAGALSFPGLESLSLQGIKGQALICKWPKTLDRLSKSIMGKGYIVPMEEGVVQIGSTYERGSIDSHVDIEKALSELAPKMRVLIPAWDKIDVIKGKAGVRITRREHYFPLLKQVSSSGWILTGLGSRGLLYHAYAAKKLVKMALGET